MADTNYQALYRRYRSQRFSEVLGQDHVTRALRNAVREGRVGHAYLFSGPRGTGKTSTARILAKVLNCAAPEDGEPCGKCDNCLAVERGLVVDWLLEQDAASKSKVDDMRDLLDRVPLGTSGNRKVIILDEVHMLSQGAENALLKTLEEPPDHVVFILATTDPQKVRETIRSRTQHFTFHLLPSEVVADHVRHVIADAGLQVDDVEGAVAHVVRVGGGSARDTLSALDQVAALGAVMTDGDQVEAIVDALITRDAGAILVAVAEATSTGRDPRGLGEAIIARLRDAFLAAMGAAEDHVPVADRPRATYVGEQLGPAGLTRALDVLGESLIELSRKPDPRVVLEVALIRLVRPDADRSIDAVLQRLERLEQGLPPGAAPAPPAAAPTSAPAAPAPEDGAPAPAAPPEPPTGDAPPPAPAAPPSGASGSGGGAGGPARAARAALAATRPGAAKSATRKPKSEPEPEPEPAAAPAPEADVPPAADPGPPTAAPAPADEGGMVEPNQLGRVWSEVLATLPISIRSKWRGGEWTAPTEPGVARFAVPNAWHQKACEEGRVEVERTLADKLGSAVRIELVAEAGGPSGSGGPADAAEDHEPEILDASEVAALPDANDVATGGVDLLMREFGGELVEEDPKP